MSHARPVPEAAIAPWPASPPPHGAAAPHDGAVADAPPGDSRATATRWAAAGIGIGSAAIVAAMLFANRDRRRK